jgi:hypothetical protein
MIKEQDGMILEATCDLCGKEWVRNTNILSPAAWEWQFFSASDDIGYTALCGKCSKKEQDEELI